MIDPHALNIYTDGSSLSKPRRGGLGVRFVYLDNAGNEITSDLELPGYKGATNNQMELMACIEALKAVMRLDAFYSKTRIVINTDSMYVVDNVNNAIYKWSRNKWCNDSGKPIENTPLWKELLKLIKQTRKRVDFDWVKGHSKDEHNIAADQLAGISARKKLKDALFYVDVRRRVSDKMTKVGSVLMRGQKVKIRIITSQLLKPQNVWKYRYEVVSKKSKFYNMVDFIYYKEVLRTTHIYLVTFNKDQKYPQIVKVIEEIIEE